MSLPVPYLQSLQSPAGGLPAGLSHWAPHLTVKSCWSVGSARSKSVCLACIRWKTHKRRQPCYAHPPPSQIALFPTNLPIILHHPGNHALCRMNWSENTWKPLSVWGEEGGRGGIHISMHMCISVWNGRGLTHQPLLGKALINFKLLKFNWKIKYFKHLLFEIYLVCGKHINIKLLHYTQRGICNIYP